MAKKLKPSLRNEVMAYLDRNPDTQVPALVVLFKRPYGTMWSARNLLAGATDRPQRARASQARVGRTRYQYRDRSRAQ
jgi:hypothetical protein